MVNYKKIFIASVLAASITFTGCASKTASKSVPSNNTSSTSTSAESKKIVSVSSSVEEMKNILENMKNELLAKHNDNVIVYANDLAEKWQDIQNNVRTNFSGMYPSIQEPMTSIGTMVNTKPIDTKNLRKTIKTLYNQLDLFEKTNAIPEGTKSMRETVKKMKGILSSNNKDQLAKNSDDLQSCWKTFKDELKKKSPTLYTRAEDPLNEISSDINAENLDNVALTATLDNLDGVLAQIYELQ